jgi:hypothetical protein
VFAVICGGLRPLCSTNAPYRLTTRFQHPRSRETADLERGRVAGDVEVSRLGARRQI